MIIDNFNTDKSVLIIAEIGNNHEGDFDRACQMLIAAANSGANAVKFQTIIPSELVSSKDEERIAKLESFRFSYQQFRQLKKLADEHQVMFFSTPFDLNSVKELNSFVPAFKVASGDNNFIPLLENIIQCNKPLILSCGLKDSFSLAETLDHLKNKYPDYDFINKVALLHCVSAYPTPDHEANLGRVKTLQQEFGYTVGYSDHTLGIDAATLAVAAGAKIIEKHFTLSKRFSDFRDHQLSADPDDFALLVKKIRQAEQFLSIPLNEVETDGAQNSRRSICARNRIMPGSKIVFEDLKWIRPAGGLSPGQESLILGKTAIEEIQPDSMILPSMVEK